MKIIATILFASFVGMALFGFAIMPATAEMGHQSDCIVSFLGGTDCVDISAMALRHIDAFSAFLFAVVFTFSLAVLALIVLNLFDYIHTIRQDQNTFLSYLSRFSFANFLATKPALSWIAIHENSPSSI